MLIITLKRLIVVITCFLTFAANAANNEQPNYVVKPTVLRVGNTGHRSVSFTFSSKLTDGPYQLIVKNGSGEVLEKQKCSGNIVKKMLCIARNILIEVRIRVERVSFAKIELNDLKIVSSNQMNRNVASFQIPVQLKASNKLQIKIGGAPTASITIEIRGKANVLLGTLAISSPINQSTLTSYSTVITGQVTSTAPNLKVLINDETEIPNIVSGTEFSYQWDYLEAGQNILTLSLYSGSTLLDSIDLDLIVFLPGTGGGLVSSSGGTVSIPDSNSSLYGSSVIIPAGALSTPT